MRPGVGTASCVNGAWMVDAPAAAAYSIDVRDDWALRGEMVEVKSQKDSLWTEQRLWLRALTEKTFLPYDNPYLFEPRPPADSASEAAAAAAAVAWEPVVKISLLKVVDPKGGKGGKQPRPAQPKQGKGRGGGGRGGGRSGGSRGGGRGGGSSSQGLGSGPGAGGKKRKAPADPAEAPPPAKQGGSSTADAIVLD